MVHTVYVLDEDGIQAKLCAISLEHCGRYRGYTFDSKEELFARSKNKNPDVFIVTQERVKDPEYIVSQARILFTKSLIIVKSLSPVNRVNFMSLMNLGVDEICGHDNQEVLQAIEKHFLIRDGLLKMKRGTTPH